MPYRITNITINSKSAGQPVELDGGENKVKVFPGQQVLVKNLSQRDRILENLGKIMVEDLQFEQQRIEAAKKKKCCGRR
jgi:hypothetical protein